MTQADIEKAYTEAVDQLARAVEANRLLTERLQAYEIREAAVRSYCAGPAAHNGGEYHDNAIGDACVECGSMETAGDVLAILDRPIGPSHDESPPASPGVPT